MSKIDLGYKYPYYDSPCCTSEGSDKKKEKKEAPTVYPSFSIENKPEVAKALMSKGDGEFEATITVKVVALNIRGERAQPYAGNSGSTMELEIRSIEVKGVNVTEGKPKEESAGEALGKFFNKAK